MVPAYKARFRFFYRWIYLHGNECFWGCWVLRSIEALIRPVSWFGACTTDKDDISRYPIDYANGGPSPWPTNIAAIVFLVLIFVVSVLGWPK